jgi:hypothetical protein
MNPDAAVALIGAALLAVLLFPRIAGVMLERIAAPRAAGSSHDRPNVVLEPARQFAS